MQIKVGRANIGAIPRFSKMASRLNKGTIQRELFYGVVDAGRRTKTQVQKAVAKQMGLKTGNYQSYVAAGTRGTPRKQILAFDIYGVKGGTNIEKYRGLKSVKISNRMNSGRQKLQRGTVKSSVWNNPRVFKRSFEGNKGGYFAMLPSTEGASTKAPMALWTFGRKENQPRGAGGRFASPGVKYGKARKLYGASLMKEIPEDQSLATFMSVGPVLLEQAVTKRLTKLMRF